MRLIWKLLRKHISVFELAVFFVANLIGMAVILAGIQIYSDLSPMLTGEKSLIGNDYMIISRPIERVGGETPKISEEEIEALRGEAFVENNQLIVRITFEPADLNEKADKIFRKLIFGSLHAVSVGFKPTAKGHMGDEERGEDPNVYYYNGQELLEVSVVNIPSNPNALMRSIEEERKNWEFEEREIKPSEAPAPDPAEEDIDNTISITARARALLAKNV